MVMDYNGTGTFPAMEQEVLVFTALYGEPIKEKDYLGKGELPLKSVTLDFGGVEKKILVSLGERSDGRCTVKLAEMGTTTEGTLYGVVVIGEPGTTPECMRSFSRSLFKTYEPISFERHPKMAEALCSMLKTERLRN
jgi:hypothetical protein